jgi:hypothetical protein
MQEDNTPKIPIFLTERALNLTMAEFKQKVMSDLRNLTGEEDFVATVPIPVIEDSKVVIKNLEAMNSLRNFTYNLLDLLTVATFKDKGEGRDTVNDIKLKELLDRKAEKNIGMSLDYTISEFDKMKEYYPMDENGKKVAGFLEVMIKEMNDYVINKKNELGITGYERKYCAIETNHKFNLLRQHDSSTHHR